MTFYFPVLGAVALAAGTVLERFVLKGKKVGIRLYQTASFLAIVAAILPFLYFFWRLDSGALEFKNIMILLVVVFLSIVANLLVFYSLKWEKISNLEPAKVLEPFFVIILAILFSFFAEGLYDRNSKIVAPALIAAGALIFSHIKRHHFQFNKYFIAAIFGSFLFALELVISRLILDFYSPITFYFFRSSAIFLLSLMIFRPKFSTLNKKTSRIIFLTGAIWVIYRIIVYYGYLKVGVIFTTLLLMLGPIFVYIFAHFFLKEKMNWRNFLASIIIVGAVIYAII